MIIAGLIIFVALAVLLAGLQKRLEDQYCMTDCCDPIDPSAYETNGKCWDCRGTGHTHDINASGKVL